MAKKTKIIYNYIIIVSKSIMKYHLHLDINSKSTMKYHLHLDNLIAFLPNYHDYNTYIDMEKKICRFDTCIVYF